jgi:hypothetical protein
MPLLFLGFLLVSVVWLLWAVWMVVWAIALLFWPVALLLGGVVLWRSQMRRWQRATVEGSPAPIRNGAFEVYRQETLRRLDEEQSRFREFLERLRKRKDKVEFDQFMAARRGRPLLGPQRDSPAA